MKVPFHLRRRPEAEPSTAVLFETESSERLLEFASKLGGDRWPTIHRVLGGYLVKLPTGARPPVGPTRLRKLAANLYLPADADLVPALLDDEASGLTRDRGLVFLPGGRVLAFDHSKPVEVATVLVADLSGVRSWIALPDRPDRPDRIVEILLDLPKAPAGSGLMGPTSDDPTDVGVKGPPRPEASSPAATIADRAKVGAGRGMIGLGAMLGLKGMAEMGARWIARAVERTPRLTESILGKQEGALRELLRQFRAGNLDEALRHALPLGGRGGRGGSPSIEESLPTVDPTYSLDALLGSGDGGGGIWLGGFDVQAELAKEYRRAAEEAEKAGDFRRAAYILGKLLNDHSNAAHMLTRGGLYHDAAMLYLDRLEDIPAAARSFEAAGEVDRALQLYRKAKLHAEAGDLLRRMGEEEAAVGEYVEAATMLINPNGGFLEAGDLLRDRALCPDLALDYYELGWVKRAYAGRTSCGLRMLAIRADRGDSAAMIAIVDEADRRSAEARRLSVGVEFPAFYNEVARLADLPSVASSRDDLRDRALMGLAAGLRHSAANLPDAKSGKLISGSFGASRAWSPDVVNDAALAVLAACDRRKAEPGPPAVAPRPTRGRRIEVFAGTVTAACHAAEAGFVFVGFETGEVYRVDVAKGEATLMDRGQGVVESIAADPDGGSCYTLRCEAVGARRLTCRRSLAPMARMSRQDRVVDGPGDFWLTPVLAERDRRTVGVWNGEELILIGGIDGLGLIKRVPMPLLKTEPDAAILLPARPGEMSGLPSILIHDGHDVCHVDGFTGEMIHRRLLNWGPTLIEGNTLLSVPMAWSNPEPEHIELVGIDGEGVAHWSLLRFDDSDLIRSSDSSSGGETRFLAATLVRAGLVAGVRPTGVDWLRCNGPRKFSLVGTTNAPMDAVVACFPSPRTEELVVVLGDGGVACLPIPR